MSKRNRPRGGQLTSVGPRPEIERLLEKGRAKEAFKLAKVSFRDDPSAENRQLLERVYLTRVKDLIRGGMPAAAAEVARHFIEFGIHDAALEGELVALLPGVGMLEEARRLATAVAAPEAQAALSVAVADRAVLHPDQVPPTMPDIRQGAERIREALNAVERQNDDRAIELLKDIPRNSPWADWRLFVRGLSCFWREDRETTMANWDRLDRQRPAYRIAAALLATWPNTGGWQEFAGVNLLPLERAVFGMPVLSQLGSLRRLVDKKNPKHDFKQAIQVLGPLSETLRRADLTLAQRLTEILLPLLIDEATSSPFEPGRALLDNFAKFAAPLPFDPHWHRLWALSWEQVEDRSAAAKIWKKYALEMEAAAGVEAGERRNLSALAWWHVGMTLASLAPGPRAMSHEAQSLRAQAVEALEKSLQLNPKRRETYDSLISLYQDWENRRQAADVRRRLLLQSPDDVEVVRDLVHDHLVLDEPQTALELARRGRELKPLDSTFADLEHWALLGTAREHALHGRFDDARACFTQAEALRPDDANDHTVLARRATLALKAGDDVEAQALIERAAATLSEPAPLWLRLSIETARYKLAAAKRRGFDRQFRAALDKKTSGETAGMLAAAVLAYREAKVEYPGQSEHLRLVVDYLRRSSRAKYSEDDLIKACQLLAGLPDEQELYGQFARRGLKKFPRSPAFLLLSVEQELRGLAPGDDPGYLLKRLHKALALAEADPQGKYADLALEIRRQLAAIESAQAAAERMAASFEQAFNARGGVPPGFASLLDDLLSGMAGEFDEDAEDDSDDFNGPFYYGEGEPRRGQQKRRKAR